VLAIRGSMAVHSSMLLLAWGGGIRVHSARDSGLEWPRSNIRLGQDQSIVRVRDDDRHSTHSNKQTNTHKKEGENKAVKSHLEESEGSVSIPTVLEAGKALLLF